MNMNGVVQAAASSATVLLLSACSTVEPLEPYSVRVSAYEAWARIGSGSAMATDPHETALGVRGNQMDVKKDLGLSASPGQRGVVEVRLGPDSELRGTFDRFHDFIGHTTLDRTRRFDGTTYAPGTFVNTDLDWDRETLSYAHRVAAIRGDGLPADVLVRIGAERDQYLTKVTGFPPPGRDRFGVAGVPTIGPEVRVGLAPGITFTAGADVGYLHNGDKRQGAADAMVGLRWNVFGPLDLLAQYEYASRHHVTQRGTDERTDVRLNANLFLVGAALHF